MPFISESRDVMPHDLLSISRQCPLSPMRVFARRIKRPFDVTVQGSHHADARDWIRFRRILRKAIGRDKIAVFRLQPAPPMRRRGVAELVTDGPPNFGGGGIPQRIINSSRSAPALRTTGAG
jgi:hypothetical protein